MSRFKRRPDDSEEMESQGELNLVPYLDIIMNLVIFLIFSFQIIIEFRLIDVIPPAVGSTASPSAGDEKPKAQITLAITKEGYTLLSSDEAMGRHDVPLKGGKYDTGALKDWLVSWKKTYDLGESIIFTADLDTEYTVVVQAMDAIRMDGKDWLFPDVLLARPSGTSVQ